MNNGLVLSLKESFKKLSFWAVVISFLFHLGLLKLKLSLPDKEIAVSLKAKEKKTIIIKLQKKLKESELDKKQIVTTENTGKEEKPKESKFLSEKNQSFDRQTVSKKIGSFKQAGKGVRSGSERIIQEVKTAQIPKKVKRPSKSKKGINRKLKKISLNDLAFGSQVPKKKPSPETERKLAALGLKSGKEGLSGLSRNNDFVEDIPLGDMTNLNTVEYKYYGFYHRIKQKLEQYWGNSLRKKAEALFKKGRRIPASENRVTSLRITMDALGNIVEIHINSTSGVRELDDAAIESFKQAGPFPNPPRGMIIDGMAQIEWGFVVKS